jgi:hypothetical protein
MAEGNQNDQRPALYVRLAEGFPMGPFALFDVNADDGFAARELTPRQVDDVARQRGLCVVPVTP